MKEACSRCCRVECQEKDGEVCRLVAQRATLAAALRSVIRTPEDPQVVRTAQAILDEMFPSPPLPTSCPVCRSPYTLKEDGTHRMHYAKVSDIRPCQMSLQRKRRT